MQIGFIEMVFLSLVVSLVLLVALLAWKVSREMREQSHRMAELNRSIDSAIRAQEGQFSQHREDASRAGDRKSVV